jgi:hypothetical protein
MKEIWSSSHTVLVRLFIGVTKYLRKQPKGESIYFDTWFWRGFSPELLAPLILDLW